MIVYTVKQNESGLWCIRTMSATLADGLQLGAAIRQARDVARTEHLESGLVTRVEMHSADAIVPLAHYQPACTRHLDRRHCVKAAAGERIDLRNRLSRAYWRGCFSCSDQELIEAIRATNSNEIGAVGLYLATRYSPKSLEDSVKTNHAAQQ